MKKTVRTAVYDDLLNIEAFRFEGLIQPFENHFHEDYVIGLVEAGKRRLSCKNREYNLQAGDVVLFQPGENHACVQSDGGILDYRGLNLPESVMLASIQKATGRRLIPRFTENVIRDSETIDAFRRLHEALMYRKRGADREGALLCLVSILLRKVGQAEWVGEPTYAREIEAACAWIQLHFNAKMDLAQIGRCVGLSQSTLLRAFVREKGITPYRYLETIRINAAKTLLEQGVSPAEAAAQTGFSDQSHMTRQFVSRIGLSPSAYRHVFLAKKKEDEPDG